MSDQKLSQLWSDLAGISQWLGKKPGYSGNCLLLQNCDGLSFSILYSWSTNVIYHNTVSHHCCCISRFSFPYNAVEAGKKVESDVNSHGPGEAFFVQCDVCKEEDIKVKFPPSLLQNTAVR